MKKNILETISFTKKCSHCNKIFEVLDLESWVYKYRFKQTMNYYHSWTCYRQAKYHNAKNVLLNTIKNREFIGIHLTYLIEKNELSITELSKQTGIAPYALSKYKTNTYTADAKTIDTLERYFNIKLKYDDKEKILQPKIKSYYN